MTTTVEFGKDQYHMQEEMIKWCDQHLNKNPTYSNWVFDKPKEWEGLGTWCVSSAFGNTFFFFKHESEAILFALKWK